LVLPVVVKPGAMSARVSSASIADAEIFPFPFGLVEAFALGLAGALGSLTSLVLDLVAG
jgi:hypothetical protein